MNSIDKSDDKKDTINYICVEKKSNYYKIDQKMDFLVTFQAMNRNLLTRNAISKLR